MRARNAGVLLGVLAGVLANAVGTALASGAARDAAVEESFAVLRSGGRASITEVNAAGALVASKSAVSRRVSLSGVRAVEGPLASEFRRHADLATSLWRAGARLDRGDAPGAEPIYEAVWASTAGVHGPTRAEAAAGLLACRVRRGAFASSIEAWAAWLAESATLEASDAERCRARLATAEGLDSSAQWLVGSPPVFAESPVVRAFASGEIVAHEAGALPDVLAIYRYAAKRDTGASRGDCAAFENAKGWNNIAGDMVLAESADPAVRDRARRRLRDRTGADAPAWQVHWARLGLGRSLRLESDSQNKTEAVLELLWIASRESVAPNVLAHALATAAETLVDLDDRAGAARVLADLESRMADHPLTGSARLSRLRVELGVQAVRTSQSSERPSAEKDAEK